MAIVFLKEIVYDKRARGLWCRLPYPLHPKGCPNFPECPPKHVDFKEVADEYYWHAVVVRFDLKAHAEEMKRRHPDWSERQARCVLYWQRRNQKVARQWAESFSPDIILDKPEACGVNLFVTMAKVCIKLKPNPDLVLRILFLGFLKKCG